MERTDEELLEELSGRDPHIRRLFQQHQKLERELVSVTKYAAYSPSAALKANEIKKEKLRGMDSMMSCLKEYRLSRQ